MLLIFLSWRVDGLELTNRITQARLDAGLTISELAEKLGVDKATVSNWESDRRQLALDRLMQIAEFLNVGVSFLLGLDQQISPSEPVSRASLPVLYAGHPFGRTAAAGRL